MKTELDILLSYPYVLSAQITERSPINHRQFIEVFFCRYRTIITTAFIRFCACFNEIWLFLPGFRILFDSSSPKWGDATSEIIFSGLYYRDFYCQNSIDFFIKRYTESRNRV
jgi:hypothetical protein